MGPVPRIALAGPFAEADAARIANLGHRLAEDRPRLRYIDYKTAEKTAHDLAQALLDRFGGDARGFTYGALPRGGHIVLGMLAYALDLPAARLAPPDPDDDRPHVLVDDCALSGARFRGILRDMPDRPVVFAPLYAVPELCAAIEAREPRVLACVRGADLVDEAPEREGANYADWYAGQEARNMTGAYWHGRPAPVGFAWNEPDAGLWNPVIETWEKAWNLIPPEACLKTAGGQGGAPARLQIMAEPTGAVGLAADVVYAELDGAILIGDGASGQTHRLQDVGADMWRALMARGSMDEAVQDLADQYEADRAVLRRDLGGFAAELADLGILAARPA
jgi:hypothetical protein